MSEELQELRKTGACRDFVRAKQGRWNHSDWVAFLGEIQDAGYRSIPDDKIGLELEEAKTEFWTAYLSLRKTFIHLKRGEWNHTDWLEFLDETQKAGYGFLTHFEVATDLEGDKSKYWNEQARLESVCRGFVNAKEGFWNHSDWIGFLANTRAGGFRFLTDAEVGLNLEKCKAEYWDVKNRETAELQRKQKQVTIRIEGKEESVEETFIVDDALLLDATQLQKFSLPSSEAESGDLTHGIARPALSWGLAPVGIVGLPFAAFDNILGDVARHIVDTAKPVAHTIKVFIKTPGGGAFLGLIIRQVVEHVCKQLKTPKRKVLLYGPDGKQIDWE